MFTLEQVLAWGRSFDEYCRMFALNEDELLSSTILGCGDGPASFNAEATPMGANVISCDPIYVWDAATIRTQIAGTCHRMLDETRRNAHEFVWSSIRSVEELGEIRIAAMERFLGDYAAGGAEGRYVAAALPTLPFRNGTFDLALCSHLLFLYSIQLSEGFHREAILELCRVAREVRLFPLLALGGSRSPHVDSAVAHLQAAGHDVSIETVPYEFQRGGNQMMRIRARAGRARRGKPG